MTITSREKEVPTHLPAARLYLDNVEEIRDIIIEAALSRVLRPELESSRTDIETRYFVENQVCTEIQDLPKITKRTRDFEMQLAAPDGFNARFGIDRYSTQWTTKGLTKADTWRAFHKLETVFERRKIRWRGFLPQDVGTIIASLTLILSLSSFFVMRAFDAIYHFVPKSVGLISALILLVIAALLGGIGFFLTRHSVAVLRYSWDQAAQREDRNTKILIGAVSALIAFLLGVASMALKRKYWP
jgi:hypothetical protein